MSRDDAVKDEKQLHVKVAEALGWKLATHPMLRGEWWLAPAVLEMSDDTGDPGGATCELPRYDEDWAATGPLISRLHIDLQYLFESKLWWAYHIETCTSFSDETSEAGGFETPLLAVCNLILALKAACKLEDSGKDRGKEQG